MVCVCFFLHAREWAEEDGVWLYVHCVIWQAGDKRRYKPERNAWVFEFSFAFLYVTVKSLFQQSCLRPFS